MSQQLLIQNCGQHSLTGPPKECKLSLTQWVTNKSKVKVTFFAKIHIVTLLTFLCNSSAVVGQTLFILFVCLGYSVQNLQNKAEVSDHFVSLPKVAKYYHLLVWTSTLRGLTMVIFQKVFLKTVMLNQIECVLSCEKCGRSFPQEIYSVQTFQVQTFPNIKRFLSNSYQIP